MITLLRFRRGLSLLALAGLLSCPGLTGCASSSSNRVDGWVPDQSYEVFQKELAGKDVTIYLGDGTVRLGQTVLINAERTSWLEPDLAERTQVATSEVWKLEANSGTKAGQGAAVGFLAGAVIGAGMGAASYSEPDLATKGETAVVWGAVFGLVGGLVGAVAGGTSSATVTYEINSDLAPPSGPTTEPPGEPVDDGFGDP